MVTNPRGYPDPTGREQSEQWVAPIMPGHPPSGIRSRRWVKWLIGGAMTLLLFAGAAGSVVATNHTRHIGSSGPTTSSTTALQQWWAGAQKDFYEMQNASEDVDQAFKRFKPGALAASCQHVHDAAEVWVQSHLPSPNAELTAELHAAVEDFHSAAHMCLAVVAGSTVNYDPEFFSSMKQANMHVRAAQKLINQLLTNV
jgi:hypothetical protein